MASKRVKKRLNAKNRQLDDEKALYAIASISTTETLFVIPEE